MNEKIKCKCGRAMRLISGTGQLVCDKCSYSRVITQAELGALL